MKKRLLAIILGVAMVFSAVACGSKEEAATDEVEEVVSGDTMAVDYEYVEPDGTTFDISTYYNDLGVDCTYQLRATGGVVNVPDDMTGSLPTPAGDYTIGFSVYYTVDEVGAMLLDSMKAYAEEAGVTLKVNDANYDQNAQNQAFLRMLYGKDRGISGKMRFQPAVGRPHGIQGQKIGKIIPMSGGFPDFCGNHFSHFCLIILPDISLMIYGKP